jgi:hypothetical protein
MNHATKAKIAAETVAICDRGHYAAAHGAIINIEEPSRQCDVK